MGSVQFLGSIRLPIKPNSFKRVAPADCVLDGLIIDVICDPIPAEYIEASCAGLTKARAIPFVIDHTVRTVTGDIE